MANHKSAKKRNRQRLVRTAHARSVRTRMRAVLKEARDAVLEGADNALALVSTASKLLDQAASKNVIPFKRASRLKSRLALHRNKGAASS
jgi:small subunit ribosomal protein S20